MSDTRLLSIKATLPAVATLAIVVPALAAVGYAYPQLWWAFVAAGAALAVASTVAINGFLPGRYLISWRQRRRRRRHRFDELPAPTIVDTAAGAAAITWARRDAEVIALIELAPTPTLPTVITTDGQIYTEDCVPLPELAKLTNQYGLHLGISVQSTGERVPRNGRWASLYAQQAGNLPIVAHRRTWIVVRLNLSEPSNLAQVCARGRAEDAAPRTLAVAAQRIALRCREAGVRASVLGDPEQWAQAWAAMNLTVVADAREYWSHLTFDTDWVGTARGYWYADGAVSTATSTAVWSHPALATATTINIRAVDARTDAVAQLDAGVIFLDGVKPIKSTVDSALRLAYGQQWPLLANAMPHYGLAAGTARPTTAPAADELDDIRIPVGASGQILGRTKSGALMAMLLVDNSGRTPRKMRIDITAEDFVVRQIILRALSCANTVAICSRDAPRWAPLIDQLGHGGELTLIDETTEHAADLVVLDESIADARSVQAVSATVAYVNPADRSGNVDASIVQMPVGPVIEVTLPGLGAIALDLLMPRFETRYIGTFVGAAPTPRPGPAPRHHGSLGPQTAPRTSSPGIQAPPTSQLVTAAARSTVHGTGTAAVGRHASVDATPTPPPPQPAVRPQAAPPISALPATGDANDEARKKAREVMAAKRAQARARATDN